MKNLISTLFILILFTSIASAQNHLPSNFFMKTLDNGLQVLVIEVRPIKMKEESTGFVYPEKQTDTVYRKEAT